ncbi:MAG: hypothetical protein JWN86_4713 [Planctomycetota bacterium]|nr:hypothetical protein [Planctomycetota bacterium]
MYLFLLPIVLVLGTHPNGDQGDGARDELKKLQGTWRAESIQIGDKKTPDASLKSFRLTIVDDNWSLSTGAAARKSKLKINPSTDPKQLDLIDMVGGKERIVRCIYTIKGDTLTVCRPYMQVDAARPTKFAADEPFVGLSVWKRETK